MWPRPISAAVGLWLMAAPAALGYGDPAQFNDRVCGPIAVTFAVVAIWEATRPVRWVNLPLGLWLTLAPWVLGYGAATPTVNSMAAGVVLAALACVRGPRQHRFGGGWRAVWRSGRPADAGAG